MKTQKDLKKEILEQEIQEVPVDPLIEIRERVDKTLKEKIEVLVKSFQDEREKGLAELAALNQSLEDLREKQKPLLTERAALVSGIMGLGSKGVFNIDQKLGWLEKQISSCQAQIGELFSRLEEIPKFDFSFLNFLYCRSRERSCE